MLDTFIDDVLDAHLSFVMVRADSVSSQVQITG